MSATGVVLWLHPLLIVAVSYLSFRYLPWRKQRFIGYALFLLTACCFDLFNVSFGNDRIDIFLQRIVLVMIAEYLWSFSRIRHTKARRIAASLVAILIVCCTWRWFVAGPLGAVTMWSPRTDDAFKTSNASYVLKDHVLPRIGRPDRRYVLVRELPGLPLEKQVDSWKTARGYGRTQFTYDWQPTGSGVRVNLVDGSSVIWSLGEGLSETSTKKP